MPGTQPIRILIVDDEAAQMRALSDTLSAQGYSTEGYVSANEALSALRKQKFDLLITDLKMPEMDGIDLLRAALEIDGTLVGVMMTGHGTVASAVEAMKAGALDYILKPFKLSAVLPVLSRALVVRQLRVQKEDLEKRVHDRTAELEAANKELESFSYSISHDLRAPLRHISGFIGLLQKSALNKLDEKEQKQFDTISGSAEHMSRLIDDLLEFSRLGRQTLKKQPVSISMLVHGVVQELRIEQPDRQLAVKIGDLPDVVGDKSLLRQVFVNLLSNAFKFTQRKENALVEAGCLQEDGQKVYFVRDNGAGFDMQFAQKLFGVFQRMHDSQDFQGTGIGLSIVQRIIHRHGGRVWAEAEVGKGATFSFTLAKPEGPGIL